MNPRKITSLLLVLLMTASALSIVASVAGGEANGGTAPLGGSRATPGLNFTWLNHDGTDFIGSSALHVFDDDLDIFIEAFPSTYYCEWDPSTITEADIIIEEYHGHVTHYDPDTVAMVQKNTGAIVVGGRQIKTDMLARGISSSKIVELQPTLGNSLSATVAGAKITAYRMIHTGVPGLEQNAYMVEMPSGIKWYHGTCTGTSNVNAYMKDDPDFYNLDAMFMDYEHNFPALDQEFEPNILGRIHVPTGQGVPTLWHNYFQDSYTLTHNTTHAYSQPPPNVAPILSQASASPLTATEDDAITFKVFYQDTDDFRNKGPKTAKVSLKDDQGTVTDHDLDPPPGGSPWTTGRLMSLSTKLSPGTYTYKFSASDLEVPATGEIDWSTESVTVRPRNKVPELQSASYVPDRGDTNTEFRFEVMYRDADDQSPATAKVYIDLVPYDMESDTVSGPWNDWVVFYYETTLDVGTNHRYYFQFSDGEDSVRLPLGSASPNWFLGPEVEMPNYAPSLGGPLFTPNSGDRSTEFTFSIVYTDEENDRATISQIHIDDVPFLMNPDNFQFDQGVRFTYRTSLDMGPHTYYFFFSDGKHDVRFPEEGTQAGPEVLNLDPRAVISSPGNGDRYTPDDYVSLRGDTSTDPDGDTLSYTWTSDIQGALGTGGILDLQLMEGSHVVTLSVEDDFGGIHTTTVTFLVRPYIPNPFVDTIESNNDQPIETDIIRITVTVGNNGEAKAMGFDVVLLVDDEVVGTDTVSVDIDALRSVTFSWTTTPGSHTVTAEVGDDSEDLVIVVAPNSLPEADPTLVNGGSKYKPGQEIYFKANATDAEADVLSFEWDFGDGGVATKEDPSHVYTEQGTYTVTLTITDERGGQTVETFEVSIVKPKKDESPGFGALIALVAVSIAVMAVTSSRRD
jgi:hypothetical protein